MVQPYEASSESCGACHERHYREWISSPHGTSGESAVFLALAAEVDAAWGEPARAACEGCHQPEHEGRPRIGCVSCHAAVANRGARDGRLVIDLSLPISGGEPPLRAPHPLRVSELLAAPDLCGTCHEVTGPALFIEPTLTEYRASPAGAAGISCQGCHMGEGPDGHTDHRFVGPDSRGALGDAAVRALVARALRLELEPGSQGRVKVRLINDGAGHNVPTGATSLRELWVEIVGGDGRRARAIELAADSRLRGRLVPLPTQADEVIHRALKPGEEIEAEERLAPPWTATLFLAPVRASVSEALGLPYEAPIEVLSVTLDAER